MGLIKIATLTLAILSTLGAAIALAIPYAAPAAMTMATMDSLFGVGRYEDTGHCDFWVLNLTKPIERIERTFDCGFYWDWTTYDDGNAYVHEVLLDHDKDRVFTVPNMDRGNLEEWYHVDGHMLTDGALRFALDDPRDAGVLMPPPGARGELTMGWVESGGQHDAPERIVYPRKLTEIGPEQVQGIDTIHWHSEFTRAKTTWHGYSIYLTEEVDLWSDPRTAWIIDMRRHVTVQMTPDQMLAAFGVQLPLALANLQTIMELDYRTVPQGTEDHRDETLFFQRLVTPIERQREILGASTVATALFGSVGLVTIANGRNGLAKAKAGTGDRKP